MARNNRRIEAKKLRGQSAVKLGITPEDSGELDRVAPIRVKSILRHYSGLSMVRG